VDHGSNTKSLARSSKSRARVLATNSRATARRMLGSALSPHSSFLPSLLIWPTSTTSSRSSATKLDRGHQQADRAKPLTSRGSNRSLSKFEPVSSQPAGEKFDEGRDRVGVFLTTIAVSARQRLSHLASLPSKLRKVQRLLGPSQETEFVQDCVVGL